MKKIYFTIAAMIVASQFSFGQWTNGTNINNTNTGNVGIGTTTPLSLLTVSGNNNNANPGNTATFSSNIGSGTVLGNQINISSSTTSWGLLAGYDGSGVASTAYHGANAGYLMNVQSGPLFLGTSNLAQMTINSAGNIGIGTTSPTGKFQVQQGSYDLLTGSTSVDIGLNSTTGGWTRAFRVVNASGSNGQNGGAFGVVGLGAIPSYAYMAIPTADPTGYNSTKILVLDNSGNVGIGLATPKNKLDVNGTIHSKSVLVDLNGWSDYVFKKDYQLPSLSEVKAYIDQNQHLPGIPSEQEMIKNGLDVSEMNKMLTKKVEELTLYLIEKEDQENTQNEKIKQLSEQLRSDKTQLQLLEARLEKLESNRK